MAFLILPKCWKAKEDTPTPTLQHPPGVCLQHANGSFHVLELGREISVKIKVIHSAFTAAGASVSYVLVSKPDQGGKENIGS